MSLCREDIEYQDVGGGGNNPAHRMQRALWLGAASGRRRLTGVTSPATHEKRKTAAVLHASALALLCYPGFPRLLLTAARRNL